MLYVPLGHSVAEERCPSVVGSAHRNPTLRLGTNVVKWSEGMKWGEGMKWDEGMKWSEGTKWVESLNNSHSRKFIKISLNDTYGTTVTGVVDIIYKKRIASDITIYSKIHYECLVNLCE